MKVTLKKDVLTPENGVGRVGETVEMVAALGKEYIAAGLAEEAASDATAATPEPKHDTKILTHETLKEDKGAKARKTKTDGPEETK